MTVRVLTGDRGRSAPGFLPAVPDHVLPWLAGELGPIERIALREIIEGADLIFVDGTTYLIAPVSARCIDALSAFEAEGEDRVHDLEDELDTNAEPDVDDEPDYDNEPKYEGMTLGERGPGHGRVSPAVVNPATGELRRWVSLR